MLGATLWPLLAKHYSLPPKSILLLCIAILELIPLYGLLAFIPAIRSLGVLGIQRPWEIYVVAVVHGVVMGGISAYARSVYGGLVPRGREAAFFALYAVTDKGSSAVGPAVVGGMVDRWGTIRPAFWFLSVLVGVAGGGLWWVDVGRGAEDVRGGGGGGYVRVRGEEGEE
jgi:UMF1 family MFS transporter